MKILYLAHRIPYPPNKGDKLRAFRQLEHLAANHEVSCACFIDDPRDMQYVVPLRRWCRDVVALRINRKRALLRGLFGLARGHTLTESFYDHAPMRAALAKMSHTTEFDCVLAFSSSMARYALTVPARRHVLDLCDLDSRKWLDYANESRAPLKWLYAAEARRLAQKEIEWIHRFDASILITKAEARHLDGAVPPGKLHIVGNGVRLPDSIDATTVSRNISTVPTPIGIRERPTRFRQSQSCRQTNRSHDDAPVVGFVGVMNYKPNVDAVVWFVRHCWAAIRRVHPRAVFRIIGRSPTKKILRLVRLSGIQIVGEVESVYDELRSVDVSVAPLRIARGLQNKVLEAMAAAKPVVLTTGAAQGIDATDGEHFLIANTPEATIRTVNRLLADPEERHAIGHAARCFVGTNHCWERELTKLEQIVTGVISTRIVRQNRLAAMPPTRRDGRIAPKPRSKPV